MQIKYLCFMVVEVRYEAVHVKEEQEMMKVALDIVAPRMSTARMLYTVHCNHTWKIHDGSLACLS